MTRLHESASSARVYFAIMPIDMRELADIGSCAASDDVSVRDTSITVVYRGWVVAYIDEIRRPRVVPLFVGRYRWIGARVLAELAAIALPEHYAIDVEVRDANHHDIAAVGTIIRRTLVMFQAGKDPDHEADQASVRMH